MEAVHFKENSRSKRISIKIRTNGQIIVTYPPGFEAKAHSFYNEKRPWIEKESQKLAQNNPSLRHITTFKTRLTTLQLIPWDEKRIKAVKVGGEIRFWYPAQIDVTHEKIQTPLKKVLEVVLRNDAKAYLPERLMQLAQQHGFTVNQIGIRNTHTRWGSCNAQKNISLSMHLMRLPDHLIDFVLLHELTHTKHMNHGPEFHKLLNKLCNGRESSLNSELKRTAKKLTYTS